jgi:hypothetical protein
VRARLSLGAYIANARAVRNGSILSIAILGAVYACGGSTDNSNASGAQSPPVTGTDAGGTDAANGVGNDSGVADAGVDAAGEDTYPAPHPPLPTLKNEGGPVITDMKMITVTFVGEPNRDTFRQFDDMVVASSSTWWTAVASEYGVHAGTGGQYVELDDTVSGKTIDNDKDLIPLLQNAVAAGKLPTPDANTLYAIYLPKTTHITLEGATSCQGFGAYHDYAKFTVNGQTVNGAFAVIPQCGTSGTSVSASHEFIEAATDPHPFTVPNPPDPTSYYVYNDAWFGNGGGEIADLCEGRGTFTLNNTPVALAWSNAAALASKNPCVPSDPTKIYFGAAFATDTVHGIHDQVGNGPDYDSEGYLLVKAGDTRNVDVTIFSEAKLPHDLTLAVLGIDGSTGQTTPTITTGVTSTLSQTTGHNGQHVTMTLKVDPSAQPGDYQFIVRATLETKDYHSWFAILRVQ